MSKRRGDFVTLDDLIAEIGVDATRFFMLRARTTRRSTSTSSSRASRTRENPVYYVQYAHARIASILRKARRRAGRGGARRATRGGLALNAVRARADQASCSRSRARSREAAERRAPHRIAAYALELGAGVRGLLPRLPGARAPAADAAALPDRAERRATQRVIARSLGLLGVAAPESM